MMVLKRSDQRKCDTNAVLAADERGVFRGQYQG